jgi:hypothetical protein
MQYRKNFITQLLSIIILLALVMLSCKNKIESSANNQPINFGDSIKFLKKTKQEPISYYDMVAQAVPLDSIKNGFEDFQMRIWLGHSMAKKIYVIIIKEKEKITTGELLAFTSIHSEGFAENIKILEYKKVQPKSGWPSLLESEEWGLMEKFFDNYDTIAYNGSGGGDGITYLFEVASRNKFKTYEFSNPEEVSSTNKYAKNILRFADLLEKEFSFKYTR